MRSYILSILLLTSFLAYAGGKKNDVITNDTTAINIEVVLNYDSLIQQAREQHERDSIFIVQLEDSIKYLQDSVKYLQDNIVKNLNIIKEQESLLLFDDSCLVTLAYRRTQEPYSENGIKKALVYYDKIHSTQLKKECSDVFSALRDYQPAYMEIIDILKKAQSDIDRVGNPFRVEEYQKSYTRALTNTLYYRKYMARKQSISIPYLERLINSALERLNKHSDTTPADFSDLL